MNNSNLKQNTLLDGVSKVINFRFNGVKERVLDLVKGKYVELVRPNHKHFIVITLLMSRRHGFN